MKALVIGGVVLAFGAAILGNEHAAAEPPAAPAWGGCCGVTPWPSGGGMMGGRYGGMMGGGGGMMGGSMARNHAAMMRGTPAAYANLHNPLPQTTATIERGAKVYGENCASCHGPTGYGDGPAASGLNPRPANLAWLSRMPMSRWDSFMFWTVSEGGAQFGTAMPGFKKSLSESDRWAVVGYIQAHLPQPTSSRPPD
jgi:mono/diheme cytochrome c family protein